MATVDRYRAATRYLEELAATRQWSTAEVNVAQFLTHLRQVEIAPNGHCKAIKRRLRDKGVRYILQCCRSMFHFGTRQGLLPQHVANPFTRFGLGQVRIRDAKPIFVFSADQELQFLEAADSWAFPIHFVLAKTGMRPGELAHLLIENLDLPSQHLTIRSKKELGWRIKTGRERTIPLLPEIIQLLQGVIGTRSEGPVFLRKQYDEQAAAAIGGDSRKLTTVAEQRLQAFGKDVKRTTTRAEVLKVLRTIWRDAGALDVDRIRTSFVQITARLGFPATCPKSWRHTFATLLQEANVDLLVRQQTLGHQPVSPEMSALGMTSVYTHTTPALQAKEIERALRLRPQSLALVSSFLAKNGIEREVEHVR